MDLKRRNRPAGPFAQFPGFGNVGNVNKFNEVDFKDSKIFLVGGGIAAFFGFGGFVSPQPDNTQRVFLIGGGAAAFKVDFINGKIESLHVDGLDFLAVGKGVKRGKLFAFIVSGPGRFNF